MFLSVFHMPKNDLTPREQREQQRVGATLRRIREMRGFDQQTFANRLVVSYSYLSNIEAGRKPLTDILLARAAQILNVKQIEIKVPDAELTGLAAS